MPVVDIHAHTFNGADIPLEGFAKYVITRGWLPARLVRRFVQFVTVQEIPDAKEIETLEELVDSPEDAAQPSAEARWKAITATLSEAIQQESKNTQDILSPVLRAPTADGLTKGDVDLDHRLNLWNFTALLTASRQDCARLMVDQYKTVDLFVPMNVDMEHFLPPRPVTTPDEQIRLQELLAIAAARGKLGRPVAIHPFVPFCPRRQVRDLQNGVAVTALMQVQDAILNRSFLGVKLYPPIGFLPLNNVATRKAGVYDGMNPEEAIQVDVALKELYAWCRDNGVSITCHCNTSNFAHKTFKNNSAPEHWERILEANKGLRLNLGHFGGMKNTGKTDWPWQIARLLKSHDNLYADVSNHKVHRGDQTDDFLEMVKEMHETPGSEAILERLMMGTDWFMLTLHNRFGEFVDLYSNAWQKMFGSANTARFEGANALAFLDLDRADSPARHRLEAWYRDVAKVPLPGFLS